MSGYYTHLVRSWPYAIAAVGLLAVVVLISVGIVSRNVGVRVSGVQTVAQVVGVWLAFLVAGGLAHDRRHVEIGYVADRLPDPVARYHALTVTALNLVVSIVFAIGGVLATIRFWDSTAPGASIPIPAYYVVVILGGLLLSLVYGRQLLATVGTDRVPSGGEEP